MKSSTVITIGPLQSWGFGFVEMSTATSPSWEWVGHFDHNGRDVRDKVTAVLLAIGMRLEGPDFHYGKRCVQAG